MYKKPKAIEELMFSYAKFGQASLKKHLTMFFKTNKSHKLF